MLPETFRGITPPVEMIATQQFQHCKSLISVFLRNY